MRRGEAAYPGPYSKWQRQVCLQTYIIPKYMLFSLCRAALLGNPKSYSPGLQEELLQD